MREFVAGAGMALCAVVAVMWWRFWARDRTPLFLLFAIAFAILALNSLVVAVTTQESETAAAYVLRLVAFLLIIGGVISENVRRPRRRKPD